MKKICIQCRTENQADYRYCKFCGAELPCVDRKNEEPLEPRVNSYDQAEPCQSDDITINEMNVFVGKNNEKIVPKFISMQENFKKTSWCWPVFLLGFFFGFVGMAAWFLYRKMNKPAIWLLSVAAVFTLADLVVNFNAIAQMYGSMFSVLRDLFLRPTLDIEYVSSMLNNITLQYNASSIGIFSVINEYVGGWVLPIIFGFYGMHIYKKHAIEKISAFKKENRENPDYMMGIYRLGGTATGAAIAAVVIFKIFTTVVSVIPMIFAI